MEKLTALFKMEEIETYTHKKRIQDEIKIFEKLNLIDFIVQVVQIYDKYISKYPVLLRGSAGSSLCLYYMGINKIDPVEYSIPLSRFINLERNTLPDIDFDVPSSVRNDLIEQIINSNKNTIRMSSITKDLTNIYWDNLIKEDPTFTTTHSSGIVIYSIDQKTIIDKNKITENQIGLTKNDIGKFELKKIDILSNTALEQLYNISSKPIDEYNFEDKKVYEYIATDDGIGITFAETPSIQNVFKILKPSNIEELSICMALIRPFASHNITMNMCWDNLKNEIIYDDDFINILKNKLKYSEDKSDSIRRLFKENKDIIKMMEFNNEIENSNLDLENKTKIKIALGNLSKYGFCKSHSINYARLIYCLYWNKFYNTKKFFKSTIISTKGYYRDWVYIRKALEYGIKFKGIENCSPFYHLIYTGYWLGKKFVSRCYFRKINKNLKNIVQTDNQSDNQLINQSDNQINNQSNNLTVNIDESSNYYKNNEYEFRGIIAGTGSISTKYKKYQMVITIGYDNNKFINIHLNKKKNIDRFKQLIGKGFLISDPVPHIIATKITLL